jgi:hypothetical protein
MPDGYRLPADDLQRLARLTHDYEAGLLSLSTASGQSTERYDGLTPCLLLEKFAVAPDVGEDEFATFGRYFVARAVQLAPTRDSVQVLRQQADYPVVHTFRLVFNGVETGELTATSSADQVREALDAIDELKGRVAVIGHKSLLGADDAEYRGRQWHIRFSADVPDGRLLSVQNPVGPMKCFVDFFWPTNLVRRVHYGLPALKDHLSPGALGWVQSLPGFGSVWLHGECYEIGI